MDFPTKNGGSFHSYVNVYQRVLPLRVKKNTERTSFGPSERQLIGIKEISQQHVRSQTLPQGKMRASGDHIGAKHWRTGTFNNPCGFAEQNSAMNISQNYTNWQIGKGKRMVLVEHGILECHEVPHFQINPKSLGFSGGVVTTTHCFPNQKIPKKQK